MRVFQPFLPSQGSQPQNAGAAPHRNRFSVSRTAGTMPVYAPKAPDALAFADTGVTPVVTTGEKPKFGDLVDVVNPLQHIPVVGMFYRNATGDRISAPAEFIGGLLFGGPIGGALALADIAVKGSTGRSIGDTMLNMAGRDTETTPLETAIRESQPVRMAGTNPVWQGFDKKLAPQTDFAMILKDLSQDKSA